METTTLQLVTIVAESILESRLERDLQKLGAHGFTVSSARGQGTRGLRTGDWEGGNVRIETIVSPAVADDILAFVAEHYFPNYAVIAWVHDVGVLRGDKYVHGDPGS
jgi:nitrogen regulatory protein P-II 2